jgi:glutamate/tyrosine decarboxylase-like PLP-dependent enzyme
MGAKNERRQRYFADSMQAHLKGRPPEKRLHLEGPGTSSLAAWFIGPQAENATIFSELVAQAILANSDDRKTMFPDDPPYVTPQRKDKDFDDSVSFMRAEYEKLLAELKGSVPFFSYRYQAHMNWDLTMPALLGYFAAMLYNQNNVALEASPVTSQLESLVGKDLCTMLGFDTTPSGDRPRPWGHITCDGSVANLEAMWAARNLKYYALSIQAALMEDSKLRAARGVTVQLGNGARVELLCQNAWTVMNVPQDQVLDLPRRIVDLCQIGQAELSAALDPYLLQTLGMQTFLARYASDFANPVVLGPATKHYSWPKNAALTGIGKSAFIDVHVDSDARMDIRDLDARLEKCLNNKWPVLMVVVVLGSTEESAVDPLAQVLKLREQYRAKGLEFVVHVDGAWGGYFSTLLRGKPTDSAPARSNDLQETPALDMSDYVTVQYEVIPGADSVTIDPHKAGYVPYAAGGLCYRNMSMRNLVAFLAPEVYHQEVLDSNMGVFGVEGSKPGAAAAGVYLSHRVIRPDRSGYGKILGQALFNSKRFYAGIVTMARPEDPFIVVPVQQIPAEREGKTPQEIQKQLVFIRKSIVDKQNNELLRDPDAFSLLKQLGSDQIIITYGLNFKVNGSLNVDPDKANAFMHKVFEKLSMSPGTGKTPELIITTSEFDPQEYGEVFVARFMRRLGLDATHVQTMDFLSSTTMCPWLTATEKGDFVPTLIAAFRNAIDRVLATSDFR